VNLLLQSLSMGFMQRALLTGLFLCVPCALLGTFMVLRRQSMIGDGLSHFAFFAIGLGLLLGLAPLPFSIPLVLLASLLVIRLPDKPSSASTGGDVAIGMISAAGLAAGVLLASLRAGTTLDLNAYLFGDILTVTWLETILASAASLGVGLLLLLKYPELFALTFDPTQARVLGLRPAALTRLLALLTALTVVIGIRLVGSLLISGLLIFPAATALHVARSFKATLLYALLFALASVLFGILLSFLLELPAGASIILLNGALYLALLPLRKGRR